MTAAAAAAVVTRLGHLVTLRLEAPVGRVYKYNYASKYGMTVGINCELRTRAEGGCLRLQFESYDIIKFCCFLAKFPF